MITKKNKLEYIEQKTVAIKEKSCKKNEKKKKKESEYPLPLPPFYPFGLHKWSWVF